MSISESRRVLRRLELEAYACVVTALRAQGQLTLEKKSVLTQLSQQLSISTDRHHAEVRRAICDDDLCYIADCVSGTESRDSWLPEARRLGRGNPKLVARHSLSASTQAQALTALGLSGLRGPGGGAVNSKGDHVEGNTDKKLPPQVQSALKIVLANHPSASNTAIGGTTKAKVPPSSSSTLSPAAPPSSTAPVLSPSSSVASPQVIKSISVGCQTIPLEAPPPVVPHPPEVPHPPSVAVSTSSIGIQVDVAIRKEDGPEVGEISAGNQQGDRGEESISSDDRMEEDVKSVKESQPTSTPHPQSMEVEQEKEKELEEDTVSEDDNVMETISAPVDDTGADKNEPPSVTVTTNMSTGTTINTSTDTSTGTPTDTSTTGMSTATDTTINTSTGTTTGTLDDTPLTTTPPHSTAIASLTTGTTPLTTGTVALTTATVPLITGTTSLTTGTVALTTATAPLITGTTPLTSSTTSFTTDTTSHTTGTAPLTTGTAPLTTGTTSLTTGTPPLTAGISRPLKRPLEEDECDSAPPSKIPTVSKEDNEEAVSTTINTDEDTSVTRESTEEDSLMECDNTQGDEIKEEFHKEEPHIESTIAQVPISSSQNVSSHNQSHDPASHDSQSPKSHFKVSEPVVRSLDIKPPPTPSASSPTSPTPEPSPLLPADEATKPIDSPITTVTNATSPAATSLVATNPAVTSPAVSLVLTHNVNSPLSMEQEAPPLVQPPSPSTQALVVPSIPPVMTASGLTISSATSTVTSLSNIMLSPPLLIVSSAPPPSSPPPVPHSQVSQSFSIAQLVTAPILTPSTLSMGSVISTPPIDLTTPTNLPATSVTPPRLLVSEPNINKSRIHSVTTPTIPNTADVPPLVTTITSSTLSLNKDGSMLESESHVTVSSSSLIPIPETSLTVPDSIPTTQVIPFSQPSISIQSQAHTLIPVPRLLDMAASNIQPLITVQSQTHTPVPIPQVASITQSLTQQQHEEQTKNDNQEEVLDVIPPLPDEPAAMDVTNNDNVNETTLGAESVSSASNQPLPPMETHSPRPLIDGQSPRPIAPVTCSSITSDIFNLLEARPLESTPHQKDDTPLDNKTTVKPSTLDPVPTSMLSDPAAKPTLNLVSPPMLPVDPPPYNQPVNYSTSALSLPYLNPPPATVEFSLPNVTPPVLPSLPSLATLNTVSNTHSIISTDTTTTIGDPSIELSSLHPLPLPSLTSNPATQSFSTLVTATVPPPTVHSIFSFPNPLTSNQQSSESSSLAGTPINEGDLLATVTSELGVESIDPSLLNMSDLLSFLPSDDVTLEDLAVTGGEISTDMVVLQEGMGGGVTPQTPLEFGLPGSSRDTHGAEFGNFSGSGLTDSLLEDVPLEIKDTVEAILKSQNNLDKI